MGSHRVHRQRGRHAARRFPLLRLSAFAVVLAFALGLATGPGSAPPAPAATAPVRVRLAAYTPDYTLGQKILDKAETRAGDWYAWGGSGPYVFDCSGLVYWAAAQRGIWIPRTTYGMLAGSSHLYRIPLSWATRGDLLFYGSGHVEFATIWWHQSFGALNWGTRVGYHTWNSYWYPTMAMRFR